MGRPKDPLPPPASEPLEELHPASDHSLLALFRKGCQDAATELYLRYAKRVRALAKAQCSPDLAREVDIDDLVQSVFGSFFRGASSGHYDVPKGEELWKLLLVIALNKIRSVAVYHRAAKRDSRLKKSGDRFTWALNNLHHDDGAYTVLQLSIEEALSRLSDDHKRVLQLRIEGHEVAEIASRTERSHRTVERLLQEARKELRSLLHASA